MKRLQRALFEKQMRFLWVPFLFICCLLITAAVLYDLSYWNRWINECFFALIFVFLLWYFVGLIVLNWRENRKHLAVLVFLSFLLILIMLDLNYYILKCEGLIEKYEAMKESGNWTNALNQKLSDLKASQDRAERLNSFVSWYLPFPLGGILGVEKYKEKNKSLPERKDFDQKYYLW